MKVATNHRDDCEHEDRHPVVEHAAQVHPQRRLKQQRGEEDVEKDVGADRQPEDRLGHGVEGVGQIGPEKEDRAGADQDAEHGEDHAVGQPEPRGERLGRADDDEEGRG